MSEPLRFELVNPALARTDSERSEDERGWAEETVFYGERRGSVGARLVVLAKLPTLDLGEGQAALGATRDSDAAISGINNLFDAMAFRVPRETWKADMSRYFDEQISFDTWTDANILVDGANQAAFGLRYRDAGVHAADLGEVYLIVVTVPAVDNPSVQRV